MHTITTPLCLGLSVPARHIGYIGGADNAYVHQEYTGWFKLPANLACPNGCILQW